VAAVSCAGALALAGCSGGDGIGAAGAAAAPKKVDLVGTWTGHRERFASTDGYRNGDATLTVTEQTGLTFQGTLARTTPEGEESDPLVGAYTPGGKLMAGGDAEGIYSFRLLDATTLDFCYVESGEGYRTTCARLRKQPG
jgi:hypothetical protein